MGFPKRTPDPFVPAFVDVWVELRERLLKGWVFRILFEAVCLTRSAYFAFRSDHYRAADATLQYSRVISLFSEVRRSRYIERVNNRIVDRCASGSNYLLASYIRSSQARSYQREFWSYGPGYARSLKYPRLNDNPEREGDLLLLKPRVGSREKGLLLLQYNDALTKFAALYDLERLASHYRIVLEPSSWGYEQARFLMFLGLSTEVVVEAQYQPDGDYIARVGRNLRAIDLGAGDWVDPELFSSNGGGQRENDVVMVASWQRLKRHALLFRSLRGIRDWVSRVVLVGYPSGGRGMSDVRDEARRHGVLDLIEFYESVPPATVAELLRSAKVSVMLSRREGANRAIYESLFCNTPVIVSECNVGVNRRHINECTGIFATDECLGKSLRTMIENFPRFQPRKWALKHTGYVNSTRRLNQFVRSVAEQRGEDWNADIFTKKNAPNAMYVHAREREEARARLVGLDEFLRS